MSCWSRRGCRSDPRRVRVSPYRDVVASGRVAGLPTPDELIELARTDPEAATVAADALDERPEVAYRVAVEHARGLVALFRFDLDAAVSQLAHAADAADAGGQPSGAASARRSLAAALTLAGRPDDALAQLDRARLVFRTGTESAAVDAQRAWILERLGRVDEALVLMNRALAAFVRAGDVVAEANVRNNRGVLLGFRHEHQRAERDLRRAAELYDQSGLARLAAETRANLGWLASRRGEVVDALRWYQSAIDDLDRLGAPSGVTRAALTELYLSARLVREAVQVGEGALVELLSSGAELDAAELRVRLAQAHLLAGAHGAAATGADRAQAAFVVQRRPAWAALAHYVAIRARWEAGERPVHLLRDAETVAGELAVTGWAVAALDARLLAGRVALALDDGERADRHLLEARAARRRGPVELRSRAWHAEALRRQSHGDDRGALAAARAGLRAVSGQQASVGATELRSHIAGFGQDLAATGLSIALRTGTPAQVFAWAERWRAGALRRPTMRRPDDDELAALLDDLRGASLAIEVAAGDGQPTADLLARQGELERLVQHRSRLTAGGDGAAGSESLAELRAVLAGRAFVELVSCAGALHAVVVTERKVSRHDLGAEADVQRELDALRFALRRLVAAPSTSARSRQGAVDGVKVAAERLARQLVRPVEARVGDRPVVISPTGSLHTVPWALLPAASRHALSVVPSAAVWMAAERRPRRRRGALFVAGPGLRHAEPEVLEVARSYRGARTLVGAAATVAATSAALARCDLAHLACHGSFRSDNPLFSSLRLADGPLTVHDLERLGDVPELIVLSACESGLSAVAPGDELMGLASAFLGLGARALVGSV
ncbi:MAG: hypothetical protein QOD72_1162, partial [Acidimicrobiaceae bacterium]|nr:hypothetical protein [Acidimicrobiaceae bacterium]